MKKIIFTLAIAALVITTFSSCRTGYGCKGRSKWITGHRPDGYGY